MSKVMISIPNEFLSLVDEYARQEHSTRSEFIRDALRHYIKTMEKPISAGKDLRNGNSNKNNELNSVNNNAFPFGKALIYNGDEI